MPDLTFGEQVKIVLGRKGMTIKELAEMIEQRTDKKMSRQNLTQRLGRDNFQEQDMRMIASILECPFKLDILGEDTPDEADQKAVEQEAVTTEEADEGTKEAERTAVEEQEMENGDADEDETDVVTDEDETAALPDEDVQDESSGRDITVGEFLEIRKSSGESAQEQLMQELYFQADTKYGGRLPIHVTMYLDEFYNTPLPDSYLNFLSTMRSREISNVIVVQNIAQIKELFKDGWETIPGNADTLVYLGGNEQSSHKYISELLGKSTIDKRSSGETLGKRGSSSRNYDVLARELMTPDEVRKLDNKKCIVIFLTEDTARTYDGKPLMLQDVLFCPILNWCMRAWMKKGVRRFFVVCDSASLEEVAACFPEEEVRTTGRNSMGVIGIRLREGDYVVAAARAKPGKAVLTITENGYGKRSPVEDYRVTARGAYGVKNYGLTDKTGAVVGVKVVDGSEDLLLVTQSGTLIRTDVDEIRTCGRASQGVIVMRFKEEGDRVIAMSLAEKEPSEDTAVSEEEAAALLEPPAEEAGTEE